jgi:GNAT superfamily N-acetyltransferase
MDMLVRPVRLPDDEPAILAYIQGLQDYELGFENKRRRDPDWAVEHWRDAQERCAQKHGAMFIAEQGGNPVGWVFAYEEHGELFIADAERRHGFLAEIFVVPSARGAGHGKRLIAAVEGWSRERGHKCLMIGVLAKNARAIRSYEGAGYEPYSLMMRRYL